MEKQWEVVLSSRGLKVLASAVQCMGRSAKDMTLVQSKDEILLRALNPAESSFFTFAFSKEFFDRFDVRDPKVTSCCKLSIRAVSQIFRRLRNISALTLNQTRLDDNEFVVFQLRSSGGVLRTHAFPLLDGVLQEAVFDRESAPHLLLASPKRLTRMLAHVQGKEVCFDCGPDVFEVRSVTLEEEDGGGGGGEGEGAGKAGSGELMTALLASPSHDFDRYLLDETVGRRLSPMNSMESVTRGPRARPRATEIPTQPWSVEVVTELKELRSFLSFADSSHVGAEAVGMYFEGRGKPILFSTTTTTVAAPFSADLIVATTTKKGFDMSQALSQAPSPPPTELRKSPPIESRSSPKHTTPKVEPKVEPKPEPPTPQSSTSLSPGFKRPRPDEDLFNASMQ